MAKKDTREILPPFNLAEALSEKTLGSDRIIHGNLLRKNLPLSVLLGIQYSFPHAIGGILYEPGRKNLFRSVSPDFLRIAPYGIQGETLITEGGTYGNPYFLKSLLLACDDFLATAAVLRQKFTEEPTTVRIQAHPQITAFFSPILQVELNTNGELTLPSTLLLSRISNPETDSEFITLRKQLFATIPKKEQGNVTIATIRQDAIRFLQERQNAEPQHYYSDTARRLNACR